MEATLMHGFEFQSGVHESKYEAEKAGRVITGYYTLMLQRANVKVLIIAPSLA